MTSPAAQATPSEIPAVPPPEVIEVAPGTERVSCDGGGGALGHPLVWYSFGDRDRVTCGYCDREFVRPAGSGH